MSVKGVITVVKGVIDVPLKVKIGLGSCIFMMRMGYSVLKALNGGKYSVTNLRENE